MRTFLIGIFAAAALVVPAQLLADENDELFARIDANQDSFVTEDEVNPEHKAHFEWMLRYSDSNKDRKLTKQEFLAPLAASRTEAEERARIAGIVKWAAVEGRKMPIEFFNRMARVAGIADYQTGDVEPYGVLQNHPDGSQKIFGVRKRRDGTIDTILLASQAKDAPVRYYRIDAAGKLIGDMHASNGKFRPLTDAEKARLKDELAYWKMWEEETKRARLARKDVPAKTGK